MKNKLALTSLTLLLLFLTGCQALGGLDVSKALVQMTSEKSMEGNLNLTMELGFNAEALAAMSGEEAAVIELLQKIQLSIHDLKVQDPTHASLKGELVLSKGAIPFHMTMVNNDLAIELEGAKKPIVIQGSMSALGGSLGPLPLTDAIQDKLQEVLPELSELVIPFLVDKASEPKTIAVTDVTETIHNEKLNLKKLHVEMDGNELHGWLVNLLTQVLSDRSGMEQIVGKLYDLLGPELIQKAAEGNTFVSSLISNREYAVAIFTSVIEGMLTNVLLEMDTDVEAEVDAEAGAGIGAGMLDSITKLALDIYFDENTNARKISAEVIIDSSLINPVVESMTLKMDHERWNINKPVKADLFDFKDGLEFNEQLTPHEILNNFEEDSLMYSLLKDDLRITRVIIPMPVGDQDDAVDGKVPFIDGNNRTLAPARFVSDMLGADIKWDGDLRQVTVISADQATTIVLTIDSNIALVNGEKVEFDTAAILVPPGHTYVPVRFIVESLGANVKFNEETRTVLIFVED